MEEKREHIFTPMIRTAGGNMGGGGGSGVDPLQNPSPPVIQIGDGAFVFSCLYLYIHFSLFHINPPFPKKMVLSTGEG